MIHDDVLEIHEIFESISGEMGIIPQGAWVTVLRLQGCNLHCSWCDAEKSQTPSERHRATLSAIMDDILQRKNKYLLITGGEPLEQPLVISLIDHLQEYEIVIQVETNGSHLLPALKNTHWVVDQKCPSSGMSRQMIPVSAMAANFKAIRSLLGFICLKFVVADDTDIEHALDIIESYIAYDFPGPFALSPVGARGEWIEAMVRQIKQRDPGLLNRIVFSVQIHKLFDMR